MPHRRDVPSIVSALVVLAACSGGTGDLGASSPPAGISSASASSPPASAPSGAAGDITAVTPVLPVTTPLTTPLTDPPSAVTTDCPAGFPEFVVCSTIALAADRAAPDQATVSLPVAVAPATGDNPARRAIVVPAGGPGYSGLDNIGFFADTPWRATHDIVTYDQRGTGLAEPNLECPERDAAFIAMLQRADPAEAERRALDAAMLACKARLEAEGVDLGDYDTEASASDLDDIRRALGYERWTILGASYGGRLALATMRSHPDGIESVILDSVYDVTAGGLSATLRAANRAIDHLVASCAAQPDCAANHPDLGATIEAVRQRYNAQPWIGDVDLQDGQGLRPFVITGDDVMAGLFNALYDDRLIPALPAIVDGLAAGQTAVLPELVRAGVDDGTAQADAMTHSVDCADNLGIPGFDAAEAAAAADPGRLSSLAVSVSARCAGWGVEPTPGPFNDPVVSDIPTLALAGSFDPITPPDGTRAVASRLTNATFLEFPAEGHIVSPAGACELAVTLAFLSDPSAALDTSCVDTLVPPDFA